MIGIVLFVIGVLFVIYSLMVLGIGFFDIFITAMLFVAPKTSMNNFSYKIKRTVHIILLTVGISLIYLFAEAAKTFVLLSI